MNAEFDLIERYFAHLTPLGADVRAGIGDDCARVTVPADAELAVSIDTLIEGVHFPVDTAAADVGWKALACGLSDLAATGAEPAWATLALTLARGDEAWLAAFAHGWGEAAAAYGVSLIGGDTTRGTSLAVTCQVAGHTPTGAALTRAGARAGDDVWVSGAPGEAAAGLAQLQGDARAVDLYLRGRLDRPTPRVALGRALRGRASACIDVSDGLAADAGHVAQASGVAVELEAGALPVSQALARAGSAERVREWILAGGDDYELCFTAAPGAIDAAALAHETATTVTRIGRVEAGSGVVLRGGDGARTALTEGGFDHFRDA